MSNRLTETAPFGAGETAASNCSRVAAACGYETASAFARMSGFSFKKLAEGIPADVERYARALDRPVGYVERGVMRAEARVVAISGERLLSRQMHRLTPRFCPMCLAEDEVSGAGRRGARGYGRMNWQILAVRTCPVHRVELASPEFGIASKLEHDFCAFLRTLPNDMDWFQAEARAMEPDALQVYSENRLAGLRDRGLWPDKMPLYDVVALSEILGAVVRHGVDYRSSLMGSIEWSRCADEGFGVLHSGEEAFREVVYSLLKREYLPRKNGSRRSLLGRLHDLLYFAVEDFDGIARTIIREAIAEMHPPATPGNGESARRVTVAAAAERFGVDRFRLRKLLREGLVISSEEMAEGPARIIVDEPIAERYASELKLSIDRREARSRLGASTIIFDALVAEGRLPPHTQVFDNKPGVYSGTRYLISNVEALLERLRSIATTGVPDEGSVSIAVVAREAGCTYREVLAVLLDGELREAYIIAKGEGFDAVRLNVCEVRRIIRAEHGKLLSVRAAAYTIGAPVKVVAGLVKRKMLSKVRKRNPDTDRMSDYLAPEVVARFSAEFVTLTSLASKCQLPKPKLRQMLASEDIEPAFAMYETSFYRRSDLPADCM